MIIKEAYQNLVNAISSYYGMLEAKSIARIVFEDVFGVYNFQKVEALSEDQKIKFEDIRQRLINKEPVQYILGQADFYGLKFKVNSHTLIPRQETEELVYWILATIKEQKIGKASVLDIGTGTGCIPITLKVKNQLLASKGLDISEEAVELAIENAKLNRVEVAFEKADILSEEVWLKLGEWDIIVSNPPYIPSSEAKLMPDHVLEYEPHLALFVEEHEPLIFYQEIARFAKQNLRKGGYLFFECNEFNASKVQALVQELGLTEVILQKDLMGKERMLRARKN
ncbi:MAG: peptide chain release factor N(5)-glutamine methyltransferase [Saprospiraceae bacterium]|nr:peptide chain release factor N(5)-glutamine methyltransferase [Saprospiraceae bacterium]